MKLFEIGQEYEFFLICAESWVQAIEIFKKEYYPNTLLKDPEYGPMYKEMLENMDVSFDKNSEWQIKEIDLSYPHKIMRISD